MWSKKIVSSHAGSQRCLILQILTSCQMAFRTH